MKLDILSNNVINSKKELYVVLSMEKVIKIKLYCISYNSYYYYYYFMNNYILLLIKFDHIF